MIYLDNAATSFPKPRSVLDAMVRAQRDFGANPGRGGHSLTMRAGDEVYAARELLSNMFHCSSDRVIFTNNCTTSLNTAINGRAKKGDHIVISDLEHNSVLRPVYDLYEEGKITYSVFTVDPKDEEKTLHNFLSSLRSNTSMVICTMVSNVFGTVLPVKRIAAECQKRKICFVLDGAQSAGVFPIDMKNDGIDILCVPGHKGLYGPMGTGVLMLGDGVDIEPLCRGGTGSFSLVKSQPEVYPDKLESGTLNLPGISGLAAGIRFIKSMGGEDKIHSREMEMAEMILSDISAIKGVTVYDDMYSEIKAPVIAFNIADIHSEQVSQALNEKGFALRAGYHCSYLAHHSRGTEKNGVVRVSPGIFNTKNEIKNFIFYLNKIAMKVNL
ncbi:MAG: aminotransferase class V-fold PLP-dependent enzyme [Acutalibacteraceae bacterium]